jgi:hypothetical protein
MQNGGTVVASANVQAPNTPKDYSYVGITNDGHSNPGNLANYTGTTLVQTDLGALNANTATGLSFHISNADLANSIVSVNWGDGSSYLDQQSSFSHVYSPGSNNGDFFVFDAGSVQSYTFSVTVGSSPGANLTETLAAFSPSTVDNPGFETPAPEIVAAVPEPAALAMLISAITALLLVRPRRPAGQVVRC